MAVVDPNGKFGSLTVIDTEKQFLRLELIRSLPVGTRLKAKFFKRDREGFLKGVRSVQWRGIVIDLVSVDVGGETFDFDIDEIDFEYAEVAAKLLGL